MNGLRLVEVLRPLLAARARAPWASAPRGDTPKEDTPLRGLERAVTAARLGGGLPHTGAQRRLYDDVQ